MDHGAPRATSVGRLADAKPVYLRKVSRGVSTSARTPKQRRELTEQHHAIMLLYYCDYNLCVGS